MLEENKAMVRRLVEGINAGDILTAPVDRIAARSVAARQDPWRSCRARGRGYQESRRRLA
jgi:hypothetical protein